MKPSKGILVSLVTNLVFISIAHAGEQSAHSRWVTFCQNTERRSFEMEVEYNALTQEEQAEIRTGMAPPSGWVHFDCKKDWDEFGAVCQRQKGVPVENCIYQKVLTKNDQD